MTRVSAVERAGATPRRGVRISKRQSGGYLAACYCGWLTTSDLRVICESDAQEHRNAHRKAGS